MLERAFLLRSCSDTVCETVTRPCMLHQIKRCSAPCTGEIGDADYNALVEEAVRFLRGESQNVRQMYHRLMLEAAERLDYEQAARYRNRLSALAHVTADQAINPEGIEEADVFAAHQDAGQTCIQVFFFRSGQNWGNRAYFPRADRSIGVDEVLESFIAQFYDDKPVPRLILLSPSVPEPGAARRSTLHQGRAPGGGPRAAARQPRPAWWSTRCRTRARRWRASSPRPPRSARCWRPCASASGCRARHAASRCSTTATSHGTNAVGAMIVAGPEGLVKNQYRKFNIKTADLTPGDDYAMMREVLTRRFKRLVLDEAEAPDRRPGRAEASSVERTLEVRDPRGRTSDGVRPGGSEASRIEPPHRRRSTGAAAAPRLRRPAGRPTTCQTISGPTPDRAVERRCQTRGHRGGVPDAARPRADRRRPRPARRRARGAGRLGIEDVALIGIAKGPDRDAGREHFHLPGRGRPMMLEPRDPVLYFVQRLRDEAHRFAIGTHRAKRSRAIAANPLDEIAGIGPRRKRALLEHFGSAKAVSRAGREDLTGRGGHQRANGAGHL